MERGRSEESQVRHETERPNRAQRHVVGHRDYVGAWQAVPELRHQARDLGT